MAPAPGGPALPEVDEVDEGLGAAAAHEARRVPLPGVAGPVGVDHRAVPRHRLLAGLAALQERGGSERGVGTWQPRSAHRMDVYSSDVPIHRVSAVHRSWPHGW